MRTALPPLATRWLAGVRASAASAAAVPSSFPSHALFSSSSSASASAVPALADWATVDPEGGNWQAYNLGVCLWSADEAGVGAEEESHVLFVSFSSAAAASNLRLKTHPHAALAASSPAPLFLSLSPH